MASVFGTPSHGSGGAAGGEGWDSGRDSGAGFKNSDCCSSREDRDTQHQGTYGVEGRHSLSWKECVGVCLGKIEPDR